MYQENKTQRIMTDKQLFNEVFSNFQEKYRGLEMVGTLVYYKGEVRFNTDGYNLCYNLLRLTKMLEAAGELR